MHTVCPKTCSASKNPPRCAARNAQRFWAGMDFTAGHVCDSAENSDDEFFPLVLHVFSGFLAHRIATRAIEPNAANPTCVPVLFVTAFSMNSCFIPHLARRISVHDEGPEGSLPSHCAARAPAENRRRTRLATHRRRRPAPGCRLAS